MPRRESLPLAASHQRRLRPVIGGRGAGVPLPAASAAPRGIGPLFTWHPSDPHRLLARGRHPPGVNVLSAASAVHPGPRSARSASPATDRRAPEAAMHDGEQAFLQKTRSLEDRRSSSLCNLRPPARVPPAGGAPGRANRRRPTRRHGTGRGLQEPPEQLATVSGYAAQVTTGIPGHDERRHRGGGIAGGDVRHQVVAR